MADEQCLDCGKTNDWKCELMGPIPEKEAYVQQGSQPGWIDPKQCCARGYCGLPGKDCGRCNRTPKVPEKLIFIVEWFDREADLVKKYTLTYFDLDKTCEVADLINNRRFLSRRRVDNVTLDNLIVSNVINIYSRHMTIIEYADSCTRQFMEPRHEVAFLLVRPHAIQCLGQIYECLDRQFRILRTRMAWLTPELARSFYQHYAAETFFKDLIDHVTSAPVVAFLLVGECAIQRLVDLAGPTDPASAKLKNAWSLRALYGTNIIHSGVDISETKECARRDLAFFFTECRLLLPRLAPVACVGKCSTLAIIKAHAVKECLTGKIMHDIVTAGFKITGMELFYLDRTHAEEIYEIYRGVLQEYSEMTAELAVGPCVVLEVSGCGEKTPSAFREVTGPMDPILAKKLRPNSLRAKYGTSRVLNAVHCTDLEEDAEMDVEYFFKILQMAH